MQALARLGVGEQLCDLRQNFEMLLGCLLGHEQEDEQRNRLAVGRFECDRLRESHEGGERLLQTLDASVRNGDAFAETGRAEALAREKIVGDGAAGDAVLVLEDQARLLEYAFLAGDGQSERRRFRGEEIWLNDSCWQADAWPEFSSSWRLVEKRSRRCWKGTRPPAQSDVEFNNNRFII